MSDSSPRWHPPQAFLELAELVLQGAIPELPPGLSGPTDADGRPVEGEVELEDAEGTPVAVLSADRRGLRALQPFSHGPLRGSRRPAHQVRAELDGGGVLAVPVAEPLGVTDVEAIRTAAAEKGQSLLWLALIGAGNAVLPPAALWRAVRKVSQDSVEAGIHSVAVPVALPRSAAEDPALIAAVAAHYGADDVHPFDPEYFLQPGQADDVHPVFEREWQAVYRPPRYHGATVFFTGLSGSGKSTVAKALAERIMGGDDERPGRDVSLLDGDEVRRMLSSGLGFSRADRDLNVLRIAYVAAEITRHGGLAVCAPIAPFADTRERARELVQGRGPFLLVHISTPLAECERRDRKGLYAKARAGEIPEFTGISSPYEEPDDADLTIDTTDLSVDDAVDQVWSLLNRLGFIPTAG